MFYNWKMHIYNVGMVNTYHIYISYIVCSICTLKAYGCHIQIPSKQCLSGQVPETCIGKNNSYFPGISQQFRGTSCLILKRNHKVCFHAWKKHDTLLQFCVIMFSQIHVTSPGVTKIHRKNWISNLGGLLESWFFNGCWAQEAATRWVQVAMGVRPSEPCDKNAETNITHCWELEGVILVLYHSGMQWLNL